MMRLVRFSRQVGSLLEASDGPDAHERGKTESAHVRQPGWRPGSVKSATILLASFLPSGGHSLPCLSAQRKQRQRLVVGQPDVEAVLHGYLAR
jgi:hypothetical protein